MPTLKSRQHMPPGGWVWFQPETGWNAPEWQGFNETVANIIAHRKSNPRFKLPTDRAAVESELEDFTVRRIMELPNASSFLLDAPQYAPPSFPTPRRRRPEDAAGGAKRAVAGASLLIDWLGDGLKPVSAPHANQRALVCSECILNRDANITQAAMGVVAKAFHLLMEARNSMGLSTPYDSKLKTCQACDCDLKLKVHAEMAHIKKHTTTDTFNKLWGGCWIRGEWNS